jgi:hypothetical protein
MIRDKLFQHGQTPRVGLAGVVEPADVLEKQGQVTVVDPQSLKVLGLSGKSATSFS